MGQLNAERIKNAHRKNMSALDTTDDAVVDKIFVRKRIQCRLFDAATAGTAMTATTFWFNDTGISWKVVSAKVVAPIAVAADNTDYATFLLAKVDSAGANSATVATADTRAASLNALAAFVEEALTLTDANAIILDGWKLNASVAKAGSGKAITAATSDAYLIVELEPV